MSAKKETKNEDVLESFFYLLESFFYLLNDFNKSKQRRTLWRVPWGSIADSILPALHSHSLQRRPK